MSFKDEIESKWGIEKKAQSLIKMVEMGWSERHPERIEESRKRVRGETNGGGRL